MSAVLDMADLASRFINATASNIFLTGKAGTGKTTFLKRLRELTYKRFIVVAPTGIAALNAGGTTIHSSFLYRWELFCPMACPMDITAITTKSIHNIPCRANTISMDCANKFCGPSTCWSSMR